MDVDALRAAWEEAAAAMPPQYELCGVVYHGPDRLPGKAWVAFLCDATSGSGTGPEGVGDDPIAALQDLVRAVHEQGS